MKPTREGVAQVVKSHVVESCPASGSFPSVDGALQLPFFLAARVGQGLEEQSFLGDVDRDGIHGGGEDGF